MRPAPILWREWLGETGIPRPLDSFLAQHRADRPTFAALTAAARWAPLVVEAWTGHSADGGPELLDQLRALDDADVLLAAANCAGRPVPKPIAERVTRARRRLERNGSLRARLLLAGIPAGFAPIIERRNFGSLPRWLLAQTEPAPLWVRAADEQAAADLRAEGYQVDADGVSLRVEGPRGITTSAVYAAGRIEGMDRSSQICAEQAVGWPGARIWDLCAGRGGKTLVLARSLAGRGAVQATDVDPHKLTVLRTRLRRAGLADHVRVWSWDGETVPAFGPEVRGGFDVVLVDAPCSSTGTWRRNPDAKLRVAPSSVSEYTALQSRLLGRALGSVRPNGRVVYVTCSFTVEENEDVVAASGAAVERSALIGPPEIDGDTMFYAVLSPGRQTHASTSASSAGSSSV